ncbi:Protein MAIN-LIKE 2 [Glycine soja]
MVRTRGLGRVLGIGRGRDISEDVPEADVPRRRRPTASARRQWVLVPVPEDVTQRVEDAPQFLEDVPHVSDGSPEMIGVAGGVETDRVASDGSLGAPADHEGFPGGPRDPSILIGFADHVAHSIWSGQGDEQLPPPSRGGDDVSSLLHIPITGALHSFEPLVTSNAVALLTELLEVTPNEATAETRQAGGPHVWLSWLRDMYQSRCQARQWVAAARTYLLHLVGCTLFANKSATQVHVVHLQAFRDLGQAGAFSWGAAALVHLYDQLNEASQAPTLQMAGYISLLQIYEHFPSVHRCVVDDGYAEASPRACRWLTERVVRQFGYIQTVPPPPVRDSLTGTDIDDWWVHFSDHVVPTGELCVVPGQVVPDNMEWFFQISHPFVTPTKEIVEPRPAPPPPPHDDDFVEPPVPEVPIALDLPTHSMVDCTGCVRIAEHLERVINLRMVNEGTDLYDIMDLCLRIARGDDPDDSLRPRQRRRIN